MISGIFSSSTHSQFLDWSTFSHVGIFDPALWTLLSPVAPLFSLVQHLPSPSFPVWISICTYEQGGRVVLDWEPDQSQNPQNCLTNDHPKTKSKERRGGLSQIKSCRQVPFQVTFQMKTFCTALGVLSFYEQDLHIWTHLVSYADIQDKQNSEQGRT